MKIAVSMGYVKMKGNLEDDCINRPFRRIDFCSYYSDSKCPRTCYYATIRKAQERQERRELFRHEDNFNIARVGE